MRIVAGKFKGITLYGPKNKKIRPLKDMVRESVFNFLTHSNKISFQLEQSNVLDLYSGTGSFGLECISRQVAQAVFIEKEKEAIKILEKNIEKLKVKDVTKIFCGDVFRVIKKEEKALFDWPHDIKFDLIFCDPPFKDASINDLIELIIEKKLLKNNGIIILHRHKNTKEKLKFYFKVIDKRVYGLSKIIFGKPLSPLS
jgi:16S rRNA (guanine966-N2)-methyltransferase